MTVIEYAEKRLNDPALLPYEQAYWAAYLDGARAQKREEEIDKEPLKCVVGNTKIFKRYKVVVQCKDCVFFGKIIYGPGEKPSGDFDGHCSYRDEPVCKDDYCSVGR